jgi:acyl-CoA thioesterase I
VRFISYSIGCLFVGVGLLLSACGGPAPAPSRSESARPAAGAPQTNKPATPDSASPPSSSPEDTRPVIVAFGDSLTAGFGADPGASFPDFLQKELDAAGLKWRVVNAGVSGDTTTDGLNRVTDVIASKPRITVLEFGGNDGLRGLPLDITRANLEQIVVALRGAGSAILLAGMTLPPNYGQDYIGGFEGIYRDLAAKYKLRRIPFLLSDVALRPGLMQQDGIHATDEGNKIVAETVMRYLKPMLH